MAKIENGYITMTPGELAACIMAPFFVSGMLALLILLVCCRRHCLSSQTRPSVLHEEQSSRDNRRKSSASMTEKSFLCETTTSKKRSGSNLTVIGKHNGSALPSITIGSVSPKQEPTRRVIRTFKREDSNSSMGSGSSSPEESEESSQSVDARFPARKSSVGLRGLNSSAGVGGVPASASPVSGSPNQSVSSCNAHRKDSLSPLPSMSGGWRRDSGSTSGGSMDAGRRDSSEMLIPTGSVNKKRTQSLTPGLGFLHTHQDQGVSLASTTASSSPALGQDMTYPHDVMSESVTLVQGANRRGRRASMQDALDPSKINASIYEHAVQPQSAKPINSIQEEGLGTLNISLSYNPDQCVLTVTLVQARDLPARAFSGTTDTYCKLCLLPDEKHRLQTKVHKNSQSPEFNEKFLFDVYPYDLPKKTLKVTLYDYDQFSRDECTGEVQLDLKSVDLTDEVNLWRSISPVEARADGKNYGDLMMSMSYLPSAGRLTLHVLKGRTLTLNEDPKSLPSTYVKVHLFINDRKIKKKKTRTIRTTHNPVWNEALTFDAAKDSLGKLRIECTVFNDSLLSNNECLGCVVIGPESGQEEAEHWKELTNQKTAARWHHLKAVDKHV